MNTKIILIMMVSFMLIGTIPVQSYIAVYPPATNFVQGYWENSAGSTASKNDDQMVFEIERDMWGDLDEIYYVSDSTVDLSEISFISVNWTRSSTVNGNVSMGISTDKNTNTFATRIRKTTDFTLTNSGLKVGTYYGNYYIKVGGDTTTSGFPGDIDLTVYDIQLHNFSYSHPMNTSSVEETTATLHGKLVNNSDTGCIVGFWVGNVSTNTSNFEKNYTANPPVFGGSATTFSYSAFGLNPGEYYYVRTWSHNGHNINVSQNETYFITQPNAPSNFRAINFSSNQIEVVWKNATIGQHTNQSVLVHYSTSSPSGTPTPNTWGTFGANESIHDNATIKGLAEETTYYFVAWTYANDSGSPSMAIFSSEYQVATNGTQGGIYSIYVKYENETDGILHGVNLSSEFGPHIFWLHYENETDYVKFFNYGDVERTVIGDFSFNETGYFNITTNNTLKYIEFEWNSTTNRSFRCNRIQIVGADQRSITFYIRTDLPIYGESSAYPNQSLVKYTYAFLDENRVFMRPNNPWVNIFTYSSNGTLMIIHSEYFDSGGYVYPWLEYSKKYFIGVYCDVLEIPRLGVCPTSETTAVDIRITYVGNISYNFFDLINLEIGWYDQGFYVDYYDTTFTTEGVWFKVYGYLNDTLLFEDVAYTSNHNFTYTLADGCNLSNAYKWQIIAVLGGIDSDGDGVVDLYNGTYYAGGDGSGIAIFPGMEPIIDIKDLDDLLEMIFGKTPFYSVDAPDTNYVRWTHVLVFALSFIMLLSFGRLNAFLGMFATGMVLMVGGVLVDGLGWIIVVAIFLLSLAIVGLIGGVEKR